MTEINRSSKEMAPTDFEQCISYAFNDQTKVLGIDGFLTLKIGHKVTITSVDSTKEDVKYYDGANLLVTLRLTYETSDKAKVIEAERIA